MLRLALLFFVIMLIASVFGFTGIAAGSAFIARIFFFIFLVLLILALVGGALRGRGPAV